MDLFSATAITFAVLLGAMVGSFLNVCVWRLPREGISVARPSRSHCPSCGSAIAWFDNIPVYSWLRLGGRCRACHAPISVRYLLVEALTGLFFGLVALRTLTMGEPRWTEFLVLATLVAALLVASLVDIDLRILPDEITLSGMMALPFIALLVPSLHARRPDSTVLRGLDALAGLLGAPAGRLPESLASGAGFWAIAVVLALGGMALGIWGFRVFWRIRHPLTPNRLRDGALAGVLLSVLLPALWYLAAHPTSTRAPATVSLFSALLGMAVGSSLVFGVGVVGSLVFRKNAMGFGDVKLMGLLGGFSGWIGVVAGFALACMIGSVVGVWRLAVMRTRYVWFGPFLSLGCVLVLLFPDALLAALDWYLGLFR